MVRLILFIAVVALVAWGVVWVSDNPGAVSLNWGGWRIDTSVGVVAAVAVLFGVAVAALYRMWLFITRTPARVTDALKQRRSHKGYKALTQGMVAVAAGDAKEAAKQVKRADGLLGDPPLTLLLKAQAAQLNGDEGAAETFFKSMLENHETEFLGLRGLLGQAMKAGDRKTALEIARRAYEIKPKSEWLADVLFELESSSGHWALASQSLKQLDKIANKSSGQPQANTAHRQAVVSFGRSLEARAGGDISGSIKWAEKALKQDPGFVPASIRLALMYGDENRPRKTTRVVENAWAKTPHPQLLGPYFRVLDAHDGLKKVKAAEKLARTNPNHPESFLVVATAALEARLWGQARTNLDSAMEKGAATRRVFAMQAALDEEEKQDSESAKRWLRLGASAPADPQWLCDDCGHVDGHWQPYCPSCGGFDTANWRSPPQGDTTALVEAKPASDTPKLTIQPGN